MENVAYGGKIRLTHKNFGECIEGKIGIWIFFVGWGHHIPLGYLMFDYWRGPYVMQLKTSRRGM